MPEAPLRVSIPAAHHRLTIVPSRHRFTLRAVVRPIEIIDSIAFVHVSVRVRRSPTPRRRTVNISSSPSRNDAAASGWSRSRLQVRSFAARSPASASGFANALASLRSTHGCWTWGDGHRRCGACATCSAAPVLGRRRPCAPQPPVPWRRRSRPGVHAKRRDSGQPGRRAVEYTSPNKSSEANAA